MMPHMVALALACVHALAAHWQLVAFLAILALSVANKLLPGHPRYSGFVRQLVSLLAASPMAGARSFVFLFVASKLGDGAAAEVFHWLSTWLDVPLLSASVTAPGGQPRLRTPLIAVACLLGMGLAGATGCGLFKSSIGADELKCVDAGVGAIEQRVAGLLLAGGPDYLAQLEAIGTGVGFATLTCAIQVAIADFQGLQAGRAAAPGMGLTADRDYSVAIARGKAAADRFAPH